MITKEEFIQKIKEEANYQRIIQKETKELFNFLTKDVFLIENKNNSQNYEIYI